MQGSTFHKPSILDQIQTSYPTPSPHVSLSTKECSKTSYSAQKTLQNTPILEFRALRECSAPCTSPNDSESVVHPEGGTRRGSAGCGHQRHRVGVHGNLEGLWQVGERQGTLFPSWRSMENAIVLKPCFLNNWSTQWCAMKLGLGAR